MDRTSARDYIRANFSDDDRLAVVLIQKSTGDVIQRVADVDRITSDRFQAWLRYMNAQRHEVYISMNALKPEARGRTKTDLAAVRHIYFDFDKEGDNAVAALRERGDLPTPNYVLQSSPGKYQVVWRVNGFAIEEAEALMKSLVREVGADPAATDAARVMRLPSFYNHKYGTPHAVSVESLSHRVWGRDAFPSISTEERAVATRCDRRPTERSSGKVSQSELDWRFALRALSRGEDPRSVRSRIAAHRPDKSNPEYYAQHTVENALLALNNGMTATHELPER